MIKILIRVFLVISTGVLLVSCGGSPSGQGPSSVTPTPPPPPAPINYNTVEFRNNYGLAQIKALAAYDAGASGAGITVAVIDSGIDIDNSQIQANIHVDSTNIATGN
ncbi:MAG TPA: peptidase S8/S53 subtilisin kexin sedolisin, partial [Sphingomonadales bacterium]|nr:peptidase S8/S53 subtilisin kexin sedolisin [Sphingomonadales bacterium]